jgi:hypothetical protein
VHQPCSNPGKSPEMLGKAPMGKCGNLQGLCKFGNVPEKC